MDASMWDQRYESSDLVWSAEPNQFLPGLVADLETGSALDLACGEGRNAVWLARQGWDVTGVDFSPVAIEKAWQLGTDEEVEWVVADVTDYEPDRQFDLAILFYLHVLPEDLAAVFERAIEALAPEGTLVAVGHAVRNLEEGYGGPQYPEILWSEDVIRPMLDGVDNIEMEERLRQVPDADATAIDLVIRAVKG
ncbi:MAG: class I SAM-dependent methyltransferase [Acidimicrobiia bacterium]|nr:class I SAM-dependent methyltransferase [Acidimicrobiia bacterium]